MNNNIIKMYHSSTDVLSLIFDAIEKDDFDFKKFVQSYIIWRKDKKANTFSIYCEKCAIYFLRLEVIFLNYVDNLLTGDKNENIKQL